MGQSGLYPLLSIFSTLAATPTTQQALLTLRSSINNLHVFKSSRHLFVLILFKLSASYAVDYSLPGTRFCFSFHNATVIWCLLPPLLRHLSPCYFKCKISKFLNYNIFCSLPASHSLDFLSKCYLINSICSNQKSPFQ